MRRRRTIPYTCPMINKCKAELDAAIDIAMDGWTEGTRAILYLIEGLAEELEAIRAINHELREWLEIREEEVEKAEDEIYRLEQQIKEERNDR